MGYRIGNTVIETFAKSLPPASAQGVLGPASASIAEYRPQSGGASFWLPDFVGHFLRRDQNPGEICPAVAETTGRLWPSSSTLEIGGRVRAVGSTISAVFGAREVPQGEYK